MPACGPQPGGLYVLLYIRDDPPKSDDFHWALYHHLDDRAGGRKYHIRGISNHWITDHGTITGVMKELFLVGLFQIADVPVGCNDDLDRTVRGIDDTINIGDITCRVWLLRVLDLLKLATGGPAALRGADIGKLEREIKDWGNAHSKSAALNEQPRPVGMSVVCDL